MCLNVAYASENNTLEQTTEISSSNQDLNAVQILRENGAKDPNQDFNTVQNLVDNTKNEDSNQDFNTVQNLVDNTKNEDSNQDFNTVQNLVDNAEDEDSIYLENGTYTSNGNSIKINKNIKIYGKGTILDANNLSGIFTVSQGMKLSLINITLINSKETAIENHGELTIIDSTFKDNSGSYGGVISNRGTLTISNSKFSNNKAAQGGVIYNYNKASIENSEFIRNSATHKCGVIYSNAGEVNITGSFFQYNDGSDEGGCIFLPSGFLNIDSSKFISNKAQSYGGAIDNSGGTAIIKNSIFDKNRAYGAGAIDNSGNTTVINSNFTNNRATVNGGAIDNNGRLNMTGCILENNIAGQKGGAVMARANTSISHSIIINNSASNADAIYEDEESILLNNNWWGSNNPDFNKLLNFEIDDDFRWILSDGSDNDLIDTFTKTTNRNNEIRNLEDPELLPPHESKYSRGDSDESNDAEKSSENTSYKSIDDSKSEMNNKTIDTQESSKTLTIMKNNPNFLAKKSMNKTDNAIKEIKEDYLNETADETSLKINDNIWILLAILLLILAYAAYKKYKNY